MSRTDVPVAGAVLALLGFAGGIIVVPQQARLYSLIPDLAPVAVGLNGSAIYVASALCAGVTGAALQVAGAVAVPIVATLLAVAALVVAIALRPGGRGVSV